MHFASIRSFFFAPALRGSAAFFTVVVKLPKPKAAAMELPTLPSGTAGATATGAATTSTAGGGVGDGHGDGVPLPTLLATGAADATTSGAEEEAEEAGCAPACGTGLVFPFNAASFAAMSAGESGMVGRERGRRGDENMGKGRSEIDREYLKDPRRANSNDENGEEGRGILLSRNRRYDEGGECGSRNNQDFLSKQSYLLTRQRERRKVTRDMLQRAYFPRTVREISTQFSRACLKCVSGLVLTSVTCLRCLGVSVMEGTFSAHLCLV